MKIIKFSIGPRFEFVWVGSPGTGVLRSKAIRHTSILKRKDEFGVIITEDLSNDAYESAKQSELAKVAAGLLCPTCRKDKSFEFCSNSYHIAE